MKLWTVLVFLGTLAVLSIGCSAETRYKILSTIFDGVPPPKPPEPLEAEGAGAPPGAVQVTRIQPRDHGPYAARLCNACHEAAATNAFVVPREQLCFKCHELKLDKKYIHGPLASGGCTACHDPHGSRYRYLLVSESDSFCLYCHDRQDVARVAAHAGASEQCTDCHDAHMSDNEYLLR